MATEPEPAKTKIHDSYVQTERLKDASYEGKSLAYLVQKLKEAIETVQVLKRAVPQKLWIKQHFSVGVNDVARILERMPAVDMALHEKSTRFNERHGSTVHLQIVLLACDCKPKWLTKHIPSLASSRNVPLICVRDNQRGSLRLGEMVGVRTALAIGVKVTGSDINNAVDDLLQNPILCHAE